MTQNRFYTSLIFLLGLLLVGTLLGPAVTPSDYMALKAQPILAQIAASDPDQRVSVIVQKADRAADVEKQVSKLGGKVTKDLSIINAFSAELSAGAVIELVRLPDVRWVSLDAPVVSSACAKCVDTSKLANAYIRAIKADQVWNNSPFLQGTGIGVAVLDSGVNPNGDLYTNMGVNRQVADVRFNSDYNQNPSDGYGHGTHVSSIVGGDGSESGGK